MSLTGHSEPFQAWDGLRASPGLAIRKKSQASAARPTEESGYLRIMTTTLRLRVTVALNVWDLHPQTLRGERIGKAGRGGCQSNIGIQGVARIGDRNCPSDSDLIGSHGVGTGSKEQKKGVQGHRPVGQAQ